MAEAKQAPQILLAKEFNLSLKDYGVFDENSPLRTAAIWGPVGSEAVLAQLFPSNVSLFHDKMNVVVARHEAINFAKTLGTHGVDLIIVRDLLASLLKPRNLKKSDVLDSLIQKARDIQSQNVTHRDGINEMIAELVDDDIERYGEPSALTLNQVLSLDPKLPLGNSIFARDQSNLLLNQRIQSAMARPIRKPEVSLYEMVYKAVGVVTGNEALQKPIKLLNGNDNVGEAVYTFEGGDAYVHDGVVYMGVGPRTTIQAALHIQNALKEELSKLGFRFAVVVDPDPEHRTFEDGMDFMHLDTFSTPLGSKQMLVCEEEASRRHVFFIENNGNIKDSAQSYIEHLVSEGNDLLVIPRTEQQSFGANLLAIDDKTMFLPLSSNTSTINGLKKLGKSIVYLDLVESTKGWGAAHCMTFQIKRG